MCGRFTISVTVDELRQYVSEAYAIDELTGDFDLPKYNVAPGHPVIAIINDGKDNRIGTLTWGFVSPFQPRLDKPRRMINARAETIAQKPTFVQSFKQRRCVIIADGFYEWQRLHDKKVPMRILMKDRRLFPMAGLWSSYVTAEGEKKHTCAIITTKANEIVLPIHERMPVILAEEARRSWLDPSAQDMRALQKLLVPHDAQSMEAYQVSDVVNKATFDDPICIQPSL
ncbi:MAG: SOS response-associated peptidase [Acholeplasmataceae bacterium]|nr:MAG: SOS response-associated peptidase [Acholeplasmataceae bacterium]